MRSFWAHFNFLKFMEVSEIKVSYTNNNPDKIKVTNSQILYELIIRQWNIGTIELQEEVKVILLNRANIVIGIYEMSKGGITGSVVDNRIILAVALKCNATSIVLIHNHPSGNVIASEQDRVITKKLKEACAMLDLVLLDHLIITKERYYSFSDEGIL